jgi:hypothetical protein
VGVTRQTHTVRGSISNRVSGTASKLSVLVHTVGTKPLLFSSGDNVSRFESQLPASHAARFGILRGKKSADISYYTAVPDLFPYGREVALVGVAPILEVRYDRIWVVAIVGRYVEIVVASRDQVKCTIQGWLAL